MADFCKACSAELFDLPSDFEGLVTEEEANDGYIANVLCETCGPIEVDHEGKCVSVDCRICKDRS